MIELEPPAPTATLDRVIELGPQLSRLTPEIERAQAVSPAAIALLRDAGCLRLAVPRAYGGAELGLAEILAVIEALSRAHGTLAWLIGQVSLSHVVFSHLGDDALREIYADGPDVFAAGAGAPLGRAVAVDGGWEVSGRWPLVSGCRHAAWLHVQCLIAASGDGVDEDGERAGALPPMRTVVLRAGEPRIIGSLDGLGLRGSGSDDVLLRACFCPAGRSCDSNADPPALTASNRVPVAAQAGLVAAAVLTGAAQAAIEAVTALAVTRRPSLRATRLSDEPVFQDRLGEACASLLTARSLLFAQVSEHDALLAPAPAGDAGSDAGDPDAETQLRAVGSKSAALARTAIESAYDLGGSSSVADLSPLHRRLRDARSLSQHAAIAPELLGRLGALAAGAGR
ncbi:MAG: acyl-CoA dehydrogenase family protein [Solirubrobacteraceae bacterium]